MLPGRFISGKFALHTRNTRLIIEEMSEESKLKDLLKKTLSRNPQNWKSRKFWEVQTREAWGDMTTVCDVVPWIGFKNKITIVY